jgi:hypothetical protein
MACGIVGASGSDVSGSASVAQDIAEAMPATNIRLKIIEIIFGRVLVIFTCFELPPGSKSLVTS